MKKIIFILFFSFFLIGCTNQKLFYLEEKYYDNNNIIEIDNKKLQSLEDNKESFLVFVYLGGCSSCANFNEVLEDFNKDANLTIYKISITELEGTSIKKIKYAPSFVVYKQGKVRSYLKSDKKEDLQFYKSKADFRKWLEKYIILSRDKNEI